MHHRKKADAVLSIHEVYPYLCVHDCAQAIDFHARAFGAQELFRLSEQSGRIGHAEIEFGPTTFMLCDDYPESKVRGPRSVGATTVAIHLNASDGDRRFDQALAAGATEVRPRDPFGREWPFGGHLEDVSPAEMQRRCAAVMAQ